MKCAFIICLLVMISFHLLAQESGEISTDKEQQLENMAETTETTPVDDSYLQQLAFYKKHPLNINTATKDELAEFNLLTDPQIEQLLQYRSLLGKLITIYELQAVPGWDIVTIKNLLPFIEVADDSRLIERLKTRWKGGDKIFILRYGRVLEKSKGYDIPVDSGKNYYLGSRDKIFLRYKYNYKNLLQWGILADKDAGEQFFRGAQRQGFDFYSFHLFARKLGVIQSFALGDFTVNLGQGLLQWQSLAFKKNADITAIKRQGPVLRPYNSAGEYNFHRGVGITLQKGKWQTTLFGSYRKISANINADSILDDGIASSFLASGYHRTAAENADRNNLAQLAAGGNVQYRQSNWHIGVNGIYYHFSKPIQKEAMPYNLFALQGNTLTNTSIDYSYTWRNIHLFGEWATDNHMHTAILNGMLLSVASNVALSIVHRKISRAYASVNANAFTENTYPLNENGLYAGLLLNPGAGLRIDAYADLFQFPWLKYRVDAPSAGKDFLIQLTYTPNKQVEVYARYKSESKMINYTNDSSVTSIVELVPKQNLRIQTAIELNKQVSLQNRVEIVWYDKGRADAGQGFLAYMEASYKYQPLHWQGNLRLQYFETDGYNERIYAYEKDLPYNFSIPFFYDKGLRYYFNMLWDASSFISGKRKHGKISLGLRWAQTVYATKSVIGSGLDVINGNKQTEVKLQCIIIPSR
ncbi:MAG: helix-hairpin-helix domain-containing protein [Chitinophagaceae bacterium]